MIRRVAALLSGSVSGQVLTLLASFLLTRLYSPEAFAHLEMFALVTGIGAVLGTGKYDQALMLPQEESEARSLFFAGQRFVAVFALFVGIAAIATSSWVSEKWSLPAWPWIAWGLPFAVALAAHARLLEYWRHRQSEVVSVAWANLSGPLASESTKIATASALPFSGLTWGAALGIFMRWAVMARGVEHPWRGKPDAEVVRAYRDYPTWVWAGSAMNRLAQWLHVLLLGVALGPVMLGLLALARRVVMQPLSLLAAAVAPVLFKSATDLADGPELNRLFFRSLAVLSSLGGVTWLAVALAPDYSMAWLFGEEWTEAMEVLRILAPWFVLNFITAGLGAMLHRTNRPRWIAALDAIHLLAVLVGFAVGTYFPHLLNSGEWSVLQAIVYAKSGYYLLNLAVLVMAVTSHADAHRQRRSE